MRSVGGVVAGSVKGVRADYHIDQGLTITGELLKGGGATLPDRQKP